jgi:hypothetical protein
MTFDKSISKHEKIYLNKHDRSTTTDKLDTLLEGFTDFADKFHSAAMGGDSIGAGKQIAGTMQQASDKISGVTSGDRAMEQSIKQGWTNMTSQQQSSYNQPNQNLQQIAQNTPGWEKYRDLTGFNRYAAEVRLNKHVTDPQQRETLGLQPRRTEVKQGEQGWEDKVKREWDRLPDAQKNSSHFKNDFTNYLNWRNTQ